MNRDAITTVTSLLDGLERIEMANLLSLNATDTDPSAPFIQGVSRAGLLQLFERVVAQLRSEIASEDARFLPVHFNWDMGGVKIFDLISNLRELDQFLRSRNWEGAILKLHILVGYQMHCGFWDRSNKRLHSLSKLQRQSFLKDLEIRRTQMEAVMNEGKGLVSSLQAHVGTIRATTDEVAQILSTVRKHNEEGSTLLANAASNEGKLVQMVGEQQRNVEQGNEFLRKSHDMLGHVNGTLREAQKSAEEVNAAIKEIQEKEALVNEIAGTAAAGLLGQKFEARKKELRIVCRAWLGGVGLALGVSAWWVWWTHKEFKLQGASIWAELGSNFGLLLPAVALLFFVIKQYLKERHFQEEYAFRASVAMTLKAFADEMVDGKPDRNQILRDTVQKLYALPSALNSNDDDNPLIAAQATQGVFKGAVELVKEIKK